MKLLLLVCFAFALPISPNFYSQIVQNIKIQSADRQLQMAANKLTKIQEGYANGGGRGISRIHKKAEQNLQVGLDKVKEVGKIHSDRQSELQRQINLARDAGKKARATALKAQKSKEAKSFKKSMKSLSDKHINVRDGFDNLAGQLL